MSNPSIEHPYDMVHVRKTGRDPGLTARVLSSRDGSFHHVEAPSAQCELPSMAPEATTSGAAVDALNEIQKALLGGEPKRKRQERASRPMVIAIDRKLRDVLVDHGDGTWSFKDEWDDRLVAASLGARPNQVHYHRLQCFGPEPAKQAATSTDPLAARAYTLVLKLYKELGLAIPD